MGRFKLLFEGAAIALIIGVCGCARNSGTEIESLAEVSFNNVGDSIRLTDYFKNISCIQLEMTDQSILGRIKTILATDGEIIILADNEVSVFNKNDGKFLRNIGGVGEGPEEYIELKDIVYDSDSRCVVGYDRMKNQFIKYTLEGEFKGTKKFEKNFIWIESFECSTDGNTLVCNLISKNNPCYAFTSIDAGGVIEEIDPVAPIYAENSVATWAKKPMSVCGNDMKFVKIFSDTIFSISNGRISPLYKLNFKRELPSKEFISQLGSFPGRPNFMSECLAKNKFTGVDKMFETSQLIVLLPHIAYEEGHYWIDKEKEKGFFVDSTPVEDMELADVASGKSIVNIMGATEEELISCFDSHIFVGLFKRIFDKLEKDIVFPEDVVKMIENVDVDGNPFLIIYSH